MKPPPPSSAATTLIRGGMKQLQKFFHNERDRFASSPILLLVPHYPSFDTSHSITTLPHDKIQINAIQQVQYILQQKLGYQTFVATCGNTSTSSSGSSYYPTLVDIENATKVSHRIGAYNVVAVGTGNVMDVGKAIYQSHDLFDELVLIPTTFGAAMVSTSSHSIIYDTHEDTLVPQPSDSSSTLSLSQQQQQQQPAQRHTSIFSMEDIDYDVTTSLFDTVTNRNITLWAFLSIVLDNIYQEIPIPVHNIHMNLSSLPKKGNHSKYDDDDDVFTRPPPSSSPMSPLPIPMEYLHMIDRIMSCLNQSSPTTPTTLMQEQHQEMLNLCYEVGNCISYGLPVTGDEEEPIYPRSLPIAMVASLSSKASNISFSQYTASTIMASFVLAYCDLILDKIQTKNRYTNTETTRNEKQLIRHLETILQKERDGTCDIPKIITTESIASLLSTIQTNQMVWNCHAQSHYDGSIDFTALFRRHLLI